MAMHEQACSACPHFELSSTPIMPSFSPYFLVRLSLLTGACALSVLPVSARDLTITVNGIRNGKGSIAALVFTAAAGFPDRSDQAVAQVRVPAQEGKLTLTLRNLPEGQVAIAVLHDENNDNQLNRNLLGIPREGVAVSGKAIGNRPPQFAESLIAIDTTLSLTLKYW